MSLNLLIKYRVGINFVSIRDKNKLVQLQHIENETITKV